LEEGHFVGTVVGAIASCVAVHFGLGIFGLEGLIHGWSNQIGAAWGFVDPTTLAHGHGGHAAHALGGAFNNVSGAATTTLPETANMFAQTASEAIGLPDPGF